MTDLNILLSFLYFTSGINFAALFTCSIILYKKRKYSFQKFFALTFFYWGISFCNIFFYDYKEFHNINCFSNTLILTLDFWIVGFMIISLLHLLHYKSSSLKHTYIVSFPFFLFTISFYITKSEYILYILQYFTSILCFVMYIYIEIQVRKYGRKIKAYHSNLEKIHLQWTVNILRICLLIVILWLILSFNFTPIIDLIYNLLMLPSILYISKRIYNQELSKELDLIEKEEINYNFHFDISEIIREKQYYLTEDLNLDVLASHIGTNRTYLSRFINNELKTNFYDYINNFRIEHAENLLKDPNCKLNLESIAYESGFRSYSTFNRFFKKKYNTTPGDFRTKHLNGNFL